MLVVVVAGCKKEQAQQAPTGSARGSGSAAVMQAGSGSARGSGARGSGAAPGDAGVAAAVVDVDLLSAIKTKVAVSSVVANPKYSPFDLFDDKLATAWNSRTGDLVGAWIAFRVPPSTLVKEVRLTAGFATTGREGDYFTMNPRIAKIAIWHDGIKLREQALDVNSRELQSVAVDATGGDYKLEVLAITPGSKKSWREICISEFQVIGRPPPGMKTGWHTPELSIASLDGKPLTLDVLELVELPDHDSVAAFCADVIGRAPGPCEPWDHKCEQAPPAKNTCGDAPDKPRALPQLPAGWKGQWVMSERGNTNLPMCNLVIEAKGRFYALEEIGGGKDCGTATSFTTDAGERKTSDEIRVAEVVDDGGEPELLLATTQPWLNPRATWTGAAEDVTETLHLCSAGTTGIPHCGQVTLAVAQIETDTGGGPGADGYAEWYAQRFRRDVSIKGGVLDVRTSAGKPDELDSSIHPGRYAIRVIED